MEPKTLHLKTFKKLAIASLAIFGLQSGLAQTNITVDANANWVGAVLCYDNTPEQPYLWYSDWALADVKTEKNTTDNTLTLYPNYNAYSATDSYWSNGDMGNKYLDGITMVIDDALATQEFTFSANVTSFTLASGYTARAFVKTFSADWATLNETYAYITETGIVSIPYNANLYAGAAHVQYGFMIHGLNANPAYMAEYGNVVVTAGEPEVPQGTVVDITATSALVGYANWFNPADNSYAGGSEWGLADIQTIINEDGTIDLHPNYNTYGDGTDAYWANGEIGAKLFEGNTYVQDESLLGQTVTFNGHCITNTFAEGYTAVAFIKVMDSNYSTVKYVNAPLTTNGDFSLTVTPADYSNGAHFQYGYTVTGLNANPAQASSIGYAKVGTSTAAVATNTKNALTVYPNPANDVLNIVNQNTIESLTVYNMLGQAVITTQPKNTTTSLNISNLNSGVYMVNATAGGKTSTIRFIKQ
ncbi:T9SS type A sorting domain-containing protein [Flavobacterium sp. RHBU_3]|uniref:T9SS type A sorting domain-containing protein n=1 Tax=Flavobacterium sp. RHBU_3 TaxID=3391184 RepID=UPI003984B820